MEPVDTTVFTLHPIGWVRNERATTQDDFWGSVISTITLDSNQFTPAATQGLSEFSHLIIVFAMHKVPAEKIVTGARHPRGQTELPLVGIFGQRAKARPNRLGVSCCELLACDGLTLTVKALDAIDGTPVIDIKPYMQSFEPQTEIREPAWISAIMAQYYD
ncbi:SAM-dependent methyltransferase [Photorhabdus laumondii]|uniref:SAM-dependent methyltransferase n=1 Tax=Photorhabdus laumondii TaxID=2218628 RepID=UPI00052C6AF8|nr:transcriptional regulator [Photorhabdus luminescens]